jgi:hypothetical protein
MANGDGAAVTGTCRSTSAAAPQPGDSGQGRPIRGTQAPREGGGGGARGAARAELEERLARIRGEAAA